MRPKRQAGESKGEFPVQHRRRDENAAVGDDGVEEPFVKCICIARFRQPAVGDDG